MKEIKIGNKFISENSPCFIIAEIGANHNNDFDKAIKLIDLSKEAGADAVKFQSYRAETLYSKYTPVKEIRGKKTNIFDLIKSCEMSYDWHEKLKKYCDEKEIIFLSSPFDFEAVESLEDVNVEAYKIASSEVSDIRLVQKIARTGKPIILSTGKHTEEEVSEAVDWIEKEGNNQIILLHCTASYPANYDSMNLNCLDTFKKRFNYLYGLSDHNTENLTAVAAIAKGVKLIEKHVTLDRTMEGPDHHFALEPKGFQELVEWVRKTERSMGTHIIGVDKSEEFGRNIGNRSIHVKKDLKIGDIISENDLIIKRPSFGISPREIDQVIGKKVTKEVKEDMWLTWEDL